MRGAFFMTINLLALILIFTAGGFLILVSFIGWKALFDNRKEGFIYDRWGTKGVRIAYFLLGVTIVALGIYAYYNGFLEPEPEQESFF
jgi:hypothetical protein